MTGRDVKSGSAESDSGADNSLVVPIPLAYAKFNPGLVVLGKMKNGLHALQSLICPLELHDSISLRLQPNAPQQINCRTEFSDSLLSHHDSRVVDLADARLHPAGLNSGENLAARAVAGFLGRYCPERDFGFDLRIRKEIPLEAGLGGGSADAAAVLLGLARYFGVSDEDAGLWELAGSLGADVPALLPRRLVMVFGSGRLVLPWPGSKTAMHQREVVIVKSGRGSSTAEAYARLKKAAIEVPQSHLSIRGAERITSYDQPLDSRFFELLQRIEPAFADLPAGAIFGETNLKALTNVVGAGRCLSPGKRAGIAEADKSGVGFRFFNDFEPILRSDDAEVAEVFKLLQDLPGCAEAVLAGSGSAVVGLVQAGATAEELANSIRERASNSCFIATSRCLPCG